MRITTQMLNESARKAGLPIHRNSLLDYINDSSGATNSNTLLQALQTKSANAANQAKYENPTKYRKQETAADELYTQTQKFAKEGEESLFEEARNTNDVSKLQKETEALAESYNSLLSALNKSTDRLDAFYLQNLKEIAQDNKKELSQIGITVAKDGTLVVDSEKFAAASVDDIEKLLGGNSSFISKLSFLSEKVGDNAAAKLASTSDSYLANGMSANSYINSKYDLWG